jgi:hypothetical protein
MSYKRLTQKSNNGLWGIDGKLVNQRQVSDKVFAEAFDIVINRLAELEDKIENGTLVELGYHIRKSYRNHDDQRYKIILIDEVEIDKIGYDGLTKAEAEKKLEELSKNP